MHGSGRVINISLMNHEDMRLSLGGGEEVVRSLFELILYLCSIQMKIRNMYDFFFWVFSEAINLVLEF